MGRKKPKLSNSTGNQRKIEEIEALIAAVSNLWKEMKRVKERLEWSGGCPLETALGIDELAKQAKELLESCCLHYASLHKGECVPEGDIASLRKSHEWLKRAWSRFLKKNGLGIIYL